LIDHGQRGSFVDYHWCIYLSSYQYHTVLEVWVLQFYFSLSRFWLFRSALCFHMNFSIRLSICGKKKKKAVVVWVGCCWTWFLWEQTLLSVCSVSKAMAVSVFDEWSYACIDLRGKFTVPFG
jgi:hypothetical protein